MTAQEQDRYLFIKEIIAKNHERETSVSSLVLIIGFFLGVLMILGFLIGILFPETIFSEKEMLQIVIFFVSDLIIIGAAVKIEFKKDEKYSRLQNALKSRVQDNNFESVDLEADRFLKDLFT